MANEIGLHKLWCQLNLLCVIYISWWTDGEGPGQRYFPQAQPIGCAEGGRGSVWVSGCGLVLWWDSGIQGAGHSARDASRGNAGRGGRVSHPEPMATEKQQHRDGWTGHFWAGPGSGKTPHASAGWNRTRSPFNDYDGLCRQVVSFASAGQFIYPETTARIRWVTVQQRHRAV